VLISRVGTPISDFSDAYQLPADFIRFISLGGQIVEWQKHRYRIMSQRQIWVNNSNLFGIQSGLSDVVQTTTETGPTIIGQSYEDIITTTTTATVSSNPTDTEGTAVNATINLRYVFNETNLTNWNQDALDLLSLFIAKKVAYKITKSNALVKSIDDDINQMLGALFAVSGQENPPLRIEKSPALSRRRWMLSSSIVASKYTIID
jgi:hypothetical protein